MVAASSMPACACAAHVHTQQHSIQHSAHVPLLPAAAFFRPRVQAAAGQRSRRSQPAAASASLSAAAAASHYAPLAFASLGGDLGSPSSVSSIAGWALGFSVAALLILRGNNSQVDQTDSQLPECPRCEGTGYTDCVCTRWSDGDVGCSGCRGTGRMPCPNCGGGGRASPLRQEVTVRARD